MRLNLEALLVRLFLLYPGFLATVIRNIIRGQNTEAGVGRFLSSILLPLLFAAGVIGEALLFGFLEVPPETRLIALGAVLSERTVGETELFVAAIYVQAILWGIAAGALDGVSPRNLLYRLSLSHVRTRGSCLWVPTLTHFGVAGTRANQVP